MDFFKSVFTDPSPSPPSSPNSSPPSSSSWQFGSAIFKTLASKSESLLDNYYKDLQEFSSGLSKETSVIREAASRAVQDLPSRLESGAAIAQESLEAVGQAIDDVGLTVSEIIGKDLNFENIRLNESDDNSGSSDCPGRDVNSGENIKPYSRLEALIHSMQCDVRTYCDEIEGSGYGEWKLGFRVEEKRDEIVNLMEENGVVRGIYDEVVGSGKVDEETFWCRYFYRVDEVVKAEETRQRIVRRAFAGEDEEELSWDVDDDEEDEKGVENVDQEGIVTKIDDVGDGESSEKRTLSNEKEGSDGKIGSDVSVISSQRSLEDDAGWDQMEDIGSGEGGSLSSNGVIDPHKRLSSAEGDEILMWDIEDHD